MSPLVLDDADARQAAVTRFDRNVVVVAGAGTGKTSLLVERLLVAVGADRVRLRQVAAVTFTEKAAGEMRERLAEGLERLALLASGRTEPDLGEAAGRAWIRLSGTMEVEAETIGRRAARGLEDLEGATITTVHGFCAEILRAFPLEAEVPPTFEIDTGERAEAAFETEWERFLARELGSGATRVELWERLLDVFPLSSLASVAREFAVDAVPADLLEHEAGRDAARHALSRICEALASEIDGLLARAPKLHARPKAFYEAIVRVLRAAATGGPDAGTTAAAAEPELSRPKAPDAAKSAGSVAGALADAGKGAFRLTGMFREIDEAIWADAVEAVRPFVGAMRDSLAAQGLVGFDALLVRTRDLLRDRPEVREHLKSRWSMLLLDEFQDTDPLQYEIVLLLAERAGETARDPFSARLEPGRLFVVGDPKQSIYRFRGADYGAFQRAVETIRGSDPVLHLTANFRSRPGLLDAVNRLFVSPGTRVWKESGKDDPVAVQPAYVAVTPGRAESPGNAPPVEVLTVNAGDDARAQPRRIAEGRALAAEILRLRGSEPGFRFRDVLVLLRSFSNVSLYARALRRAGIPFVVDGGRSFFERTEVVQFLAVLRVLAVPADPVALLAFLRSPAGAVDDAELDRWAASGGRWSREEEPDPSAFPRLARALGRLREWAREVRDLPADRAILHVLERSGLLPFGAFAYEGAQRVANLRKLAARAAELARDGSLSWVQVLDAVSDRKGSDVESESPLADERTEAVRILTIHKAKGLEARFVFVGDLARREGSRSPSDDVSVASCTFPLGRALSASSRVAGRWNTAAVAAEVEGARHEEAEGARLLYVAATRARERLVLLAAPAAEGKEPPWLSALAAWGYRAAAPPVDGARLAEGQVLHRLVTAEEPEPLPSPAPAPLPDPAAYRSAVEGARAAADRAALRRAGDRPSREPGEEGSALPRGTLERSVAQAVGSVVHRILEDWPAAAGAGLDVRVIAASRVEGARRGVDAGTVAREAGAVLDAFAGGPLAARLGRVEIVAREVPLVWRDDEGAWKGIADLVYRTGDGREVLADWKTDLDAAGAVARHGAQVRRYARALRLALGLDAAPRAELWMVRTGEVLLVPSEEAAP